MEPRYYRYRDEARDAGEGARPLFGPLFIASRNRLNPCYRNLPPLGFGKQLIPLKKSVPGAIFLG